MTRGQTFDVRRTIKRCTECGQRFSADAMFCPFDGTKLESQAWDPTGDGLIGQVVDGRYEVLSVLGEGGMGRVYRVRHVSLDRPFAMKVLRKDLARDEELAARFIQEAKLTASVRHPHIVSISDFGRLPDETPYFVMELLTGVTLSEVIKSGGPIPAARAVRIVKQIASALGAAHAAGIVHRDLKPENVFLVGGMTGGATKDDVRIVDFGAAKIMGASRLTKTGIVFGTPHYMSPEQASGQPVDHRADVYALGIIMYEMFTGRVPFEADTYMGVLTQHMFVQPVPPSQVNASAKELGALEQITLHALEKKPEERYASMEELADDVDKVVRTSSEGRLEIAPQLARASAPPRSVKYKMADELEPPTLEEMRLATDSLAPPRRAAPWGWVAVGVAVAGVAIGAGVLLTRKEAPEAPAPEARAAAATTAEKPAPPAPPSAVAPAPSAAPPAKKVVHVSAVPSADVYDGARRIGATPVDVAFDPAAPAHYVVKAPGYADQDLALDATSATDVKVELKRAAQAAPPPAMTRAPAAAPTPPRKGGGLDDLPAVGVWK